MDRIRNFITGSAGTNENPLVRLVRTALLAAGAAGIAVAIQQGVTLPESFVWAAPLITGALTAADKWLIRHEAPTSAPSAPLVSTTPPA